MGYFGRLDVKQEAREMRRAGKSYQEIIERLHLSKSTVSDWCKDVLLTKAQLLKLYQNKRTGALKGSVVAAQRKQEQRIEITRNLFNQAKREIGSLSKRDRFVVGIALYAAEGTKVDKSCCFSNSDATLVKFMAHWFREFGKVPTAKFRGALWLHEGLNENKAKEFWANLIKIPVSQFYKTYISKDKKDSKKIRKNLHPFGIFSLYVSDVTLLRKIMGWIAGIVRKSWYNI